MVAASLDAWRELPRLDGAIPFEAWLYRRLLARGREAARRRGPVREIAVGVTPGQGVDGFASAATVEPPPLEGPTREALVARMDAGARSTRQALAWFPARIAHVPGRAWPAIGAGSLVLAIAALNASASPSLPVPASGEPVSSVAGLPAASAVPPGAPCATDTARVLTGAAMPSPVATSITIDPRVAGRGVYVTGSQATRFEVWSVEVGDAVRIAAVDGPGVDTVSVDDLSANGGQALLTVGHMAAIGPGPDCIDLYVLSTDGSGAQRLTRYGPNEVTTLPAISPDGRYVAFGHTTFEPLQASVTVVDLATEDLRPREMVCNPAYSNPIRWASWIDRLAAICAGRLEVHFGPDSSARYDLPVGSESLLGFGWLARDKLVIASPAGITTRPGIAIRSFDLTLGTVDQYVPIGVPGIEWLTSEGGGPVSPDGRSMLLQGIPVDHPDISPQGYVVPTAGGTPIQVTRGANTDDGWSADSRAVVYVEPGSLPGPGLVRYDLTSHEARTIAILPGTYRQGVWRMP